MKSHLKRHFAPRSWRIKRKGIKYITRPFPGAHSFKEGTSLSTLFKYILKKAATSVEVKKILKINNVKVDNRRITHPKYLIGLMDTMEIAESKEYFRMMISRNGEIFMLPIPADEAALKLCKVIGKTLLKKNKMQLNLFDGRNIIVGKDSCKVGDTLLISLPTQEIKDHFKFGKGSCVYFTGGKYVGCGGIVEDIKGSCIICKVDGNAVETLKEFAFVVGKNKPAIKIFENESNATN